MEYAGIKPRWVVVLSPEAYQRASKTLNQQWLKPSPAELNAVNTLCKRPLACETDARHALTQFEQTRQCHVRSETTIQAIPRFKGNGRPAKNRQPDYFEYHLDGARASHLPARSRRLPRQSCFSLASNQLNTEKLAEAALIAAYQEQPPVERGFRFLNDPMFMASTLYLNSPKRIEALMMVMTLSRLVYAVLEPRLRDRQKKPEVTFPNQQGQPIPNPTAPWGFQFFLVFKCSLSSKMNTFPSWYSTSMNLKWPCSEA